MRGPPAQTTKRSRRPAGLEELDELGHVVDVDVLLGHDLADQDGVGIHLDREVDELLVRDLRAEVVGLQLRVALQAVVVVVALHVHDGVDAHGVRVEAGAGADDDDLAAEARRGSPCTSSIE